MKYKKLDKPLLYDGSQIKPMWAFKEIGVKGSSLISWIGPMKIKTNHIIDFEDTGVEIKSDKMINFMVEHFDIQPADLKTCYHRQRILVMIVKDDLEEFGIKTLREGDDLYFEDKKLSVSIATCSNSSMKIHFGINVTNEGTPNDVDTIGLLECNKNMDEEKIHFLMDKIAKTYINEMESIEEDITKSKVF